MNNPMVLSMPENKTKTLSQAVKKHGNQLLGFIKSKVKSLEDAEDILQDVWYQFTNLANVDEIESVSGWLYFVAKNKITDLYRKKKPVALEDMSYETEEGDFLLKDILLLDESNNPELDLHKDIFWKELMDALDELPENQKQVFILNEIEDKTLKQIANMQGENIKTIISRKSYAVKHLRKQLQHLYQELYT